MLARLYHTPVSGPFTGAAAFMKGARQKHAHDV